MPQNERLHLGAPAEGKATPRDAQDDWELERLRATLRELADDRLSSARDLVLEASDALRAWALTAGESWTWDVAGDVLESELAPFLAQQEWRGSVALWIDSVRRAFHHGRARKIEPRIAIAEELGLWVWDPAGVVGLEACNEEWNGDPASAGRRFPRREDCAKTAAETIEPGELVLVASDSETIALALVEAWRQGKQPAALIAEGLPHLDGRQMARRLVSQGIHVTMCYDAALVSLVPSADRVWLGTETLGVAGFLARVGTTALLEECERHDVPAALLATSDKLVPGGDAVLPTWPERSPWLLWDDEPVGVRLASQYIELVSHALVGDLFTERGREAFATLALRALRTEPAAPCNRRPIADASARPLAHERTSAFAP